MSPLLINITASSVLFIFLSFLLYYLQGDFFRILFTLICFLMSAWFSFLGSSTLAIFVVFWPIATLLLPKTYNTQISAEKVIIAVCTGTVMFLVLLMIAQMKNIIAFYVCALISASIINIILTNDPAKFSIGVAIMGLGTSFFAPNNYYRTIIILFVFSISVINYFIRTEK